MTRHLHLRSVLRECAAWACLASLGLLWPASARAQTGGLKLAISPLRVEFNLQPGASYTDAAHVANDGTMPVRLLATVNDWTITAAGSPEFLPPGAPAPDPFACAAWIRLSPDSFELAPGAMQRVRFTVQVPPGTPAMGCRAALLFTSAPPLVRPVGKQVLTRARLASILYIRVGHPEVAGGAADVSLTPAGSGAWAMSLVVRNQGRTYFRANGQLTLLDAAGQVLAQAPLDSQIVLPGTARRFTFPVTASLAPGTYRLRATVDVGEPALSRIEKSVVIGAAPAASLAGKP
ncbi:MAG TPA: hypothetical protein VE996_14665 [Terriglobales bacterium]|nr:hypothetical protein [Terriglobales bacterium]